VKKKHWWRQGHPRTLNIRATFKLGSALFKEKAKGRYFNCLSIYHQGILAEQMRQPHQPDQETSMVLEDTLIHHSDAILIRPETSTPISCNMAKEQHDIRG
jgi:hypothetical protein